ncbi:hypothetical protein GGE65_002920 [Skermanella aerolata]|uniref:DUF262 domain-containing protein n=1 Tax=Skermanella aerolata TaxID=393310 RepID=UPI003D1D61C0
MASLFPDPSVNLFPGEEINLTKFQLSSTVVMSDEKINEKYAKGDVRIITEQARYPLSQIPIMLKTGDYKLNPEFQRRHRWDSEKRSRLVESFIMNVPVPPIFLYEDKFSHYEVMDGLQRLTAINEFYQDNLRLEGLLEWPELNGRFYSQLPEQVRRGVDRRYLSSIILLHETAKSEIEAQQLKQLVFERINSGGVYLEPQESRNAIYNGSMNELCIQLSRNIYLCRTWGIPEPTIEEISHNNPDSSVINNELFRKMADVELVLRFFAYRQRLNNHRGSLKSYFDKYLQQANLFPADTLRNLKSTFEDTINLAYDIFGDRAFWLLRKRDNRWNWYARPTTAVYDPLMFTLSKALASRGTLVNKSEEIRDALPTFYQENYAMFEGRYTNLSDIEARNILFQKFLKQFL